MIEAPSPAERELPERLRRYSRYVALVAEQLQARRSSDTEQLRRLTLERASLEAELELEGTDLEALDPAPPRLQEVLRIGLVELEDRAATERSLAELWASISDGALRHARFIPVPKIRTRCYPELADHRSRFDLRF